MAGQTLAEYSQCLFSTQLGARPPRPATSASNPIPAGVIVRSNPLHDAVKYASLLRQEYPLQCSQIYAGFQRSDFFDPYDIHLHGDHFLDTVLLILSEPNNFRVAQFAIEFATSNPGAVKELANYSIKSTHELTEAVHRFFDDSQITKHGPFMLAHVVHHLKQTLKTWHKQKLAKVPETSSTSATQRSPPESSDPKPPRRSTDESTHKQQPNLTKKQSKAALKNKKKNEEKAFGNKRLNDTQRSNDIPLSELNPPPIVPRGFEYVVPDQLGLGLHMHDPRRTVSAENAAHSLAMDPQRAFRAYSGAQMAPRAMSSAQNVPFHNISPMVSPATPVFSPDPAQLGRVRNISGNPSYAQSRHLPPSNLQATAPIWKQSAGAHEVKHPYPAQLQVQQQFYDPSPHHQAAHNPMTSPALRSVAMAQHAMEGVPNQANPMTQAGAPFQGQGVPFFDSSMHMSPHAVTNVNNIVLRQPSGGPMAETTNLMYAHHQQQYQPQRNDKFREFGHKDQRDGTAQRNHHRGQQRMASENIRAYSKQNYDRKFSVGSASGSGAFGRPRGASNSFQAQSRDASTLNYSADARAYLSHHIDRVTHSDERSDPFPPFEQLSRSTTEENEYPRDPINGCGKDFIGTARDDIRDLFVTGFPTDVDSTVNGDILKKLFGGESIVRLVSMTCKMGPNNTGSRHAFVHFHSTELARAALSLNGNESYGKLIVTVPQRYWRSFRKGSQSGFVQQREEYDYSYRRNSTLSQGRRNSTDQQGASIGDRSPHAPGNLVQARTSTMPTQHHADESGPRRSSDASRVDSLRTSFPFANRGQALHRVKIPETDEHVNVDSAVQYSPQDCRSGLRPQRTQGQLDTHSSPERKKKGRRVQASTDATNSTTIEPETLAKPLVPSEQTRLSNPNISPTSQTIEAALDVELDEDKVVLADCSKESSEVALFEDDVSDLTSRPTASQLKMIELATASPAAEDHISSPSKTGENPSESVKASVKVNEGGEAAKMPNSTAKITEVSGTFDSVVPETPRGDDSFHSAVEDQGNKDQSAATASHMIIPDVDTPLISPKTIVPPDLPAEEDGNRGAGDPNVLVGCSGNAEATAEQVALEDNGQCRGSTPLTRPELSVEELSDDVIATDLSEGTDVSGSKSGPEHASVNDTYAETKTQEASVQVTTIAEVTTTGELSATESTAAKKGKSKSQPAQPQEALHPFARANQAKKTAKASKKAKKKEKERAKREATQSTSTDVKDEPANKSSAVEPAPAPVGDKPQDSTAQTEDIQEQEAKEDKSCVTQTNTSKTAAMPKASEMGQSELIEPTNVKQKPKAEPPTNKSKTKVLLEKASGSSKPQSIEGDKENPNHPRWKSLVESKTSSSAAAKADAKAKDTKGLWSKIAMPDIGLISRKEKGGSSSGEKSGSASTSASGVGKN